MIVSRIGIVVMPPPPMSESTMRKTCETDTFCNLNFELAPMTCEFIRDSVFFGFGVEAPVKAPKIS